MAVVKVGTGDEDGVINDENAAIIASESIRGAFLSPLICHGGKDFSCPDWWSARSFVWCNV
jgi:hypothetical protein